MESTDSHEPEVSVNHFVILYLNFSATKLKRVHILALSFTTS